MDVLDDAVTDARTLVAEKNPYLTAPEPIRGNRGVGCPGYLSARLRESGHRL